MNCPAHRNALMKASIVALLAAPYLCQAQAAPTADITQRVEAPAEAPEAEPGSVVLGSEEIATGLGADNDLNKLGKTIGGIQYSREEGRLTEDAILNTRPALLSIGGAGTQENNFTVEGLSTNSIRDTTNTNMHHYMEVVGHPQTTFVAPQLVESVTFHTFGVPAEFGRFRGGVIDVKLRDPRAVAGGTVSVGYTDDNLTHFIYDPDHASATMPNKDEFSKRSYSATADLPLSARTGLLVGVAREETRLSSVQNHASYGMYERSARTDKNSAMVRLVHRLDERNTLRFTSLPATYAQENREQSLKIQNNDGWLNKLEWQHQGERLKLNAFVGAMFSDTDREAEPNLYTYRNFGDTDKVDWVAASNTSGLKGGFGDMISSQDEFTAGLKAAYRLTDTGWLSAGTSHTLTKARQSRPETNSAYRHQSTPSAINPLVRSGDGADDLTVIEGEQALNYRIVYQAFDTRVELNTSDAWTQWQDKGSVAGMAWNYRAGLRYDYNDLLRNHDLSPRFTAQLTPRPWISLHAGWNRYHSNAMIAYALRENYPGNYIYTRKARSENGYQVYYASDWTLYSHTETTSYGQAGLRTPYSDELAGGITLRPWKLGTFKAVAVDRHAQDSLSRDAGTKITYVSESTGKTATYTLYKVTNGGWTKHKDLKFSWEKRWKNHVLGLDYVHTQTRTTNEEYFEAADTESMDQLVSHDGVLRTRREVALQRMNFAVPDYATLAWRARWFNGRLSTTLLGRWEAAFTRTEDANTTQKINGVSYDFFTDVDVPATLMNDVNIGWTAWRRGRMELQLDARIGNVLDKLPHAEGASVSSPYQVGRTVWFGATLSF